MKSTLIAAAAVAAMSITACTPTTPEDRTTLGAVGGAAAGFLVADALRANPTWTVVAVLGGAAAGTLVARNADKQTCAYARGDGTYYTAPCP